MVEVKMSGAEYNEFFIKSEQADEMVELLCNTQVPRFTQQGLYYHAHFDNDVEYPDWLRDKLVDRLIYELMKLEDEQWELFCLMKEPYYNPALRSFSSYTYVGYVDLLARNRKLKERWDETQRYLEEVPPQDREA